MSYIPSPWFVCFITGSLYLLTPFPNLANLQPVLMATTTLFYLWTWLFQAHFPFSWRIVHGHSQITLLPYPVELEKPSSFSLFHTVLISFKSNWQCFCLYNLTVFLPSDNPAMPLVVFPEYVFLFFTIWAGCEFSKSLS